MLGFTLGEKQYQTQIFNKKGERIPVTFIKTSPCFIINIKEYPETGIFRFKMGFGQIKNLKNSVRGELNKAGIKTPLHFLKEFTTDKYKGKKTMTIKDLKFQIGQELKPNQIFNIGDFVDVSGTSKGKGFQGVVKRHKFAGGPKTHGQSDRERAPGSIGQTTTPGRVYKGKRMAGRMGGNRATIKHLEIIDVKDDGFFLKGLIPGAKKGVVEVKIAK